MGTKLAPGGRRRRLALIRGANGRVLALSVDLLASLQSPKLGLKQTYSRRRFSADAGPNRDMGLERCALQQRVSSNRVRTSRRLVMKPTCRDRILLRLEVHQNVMRSDFGLTLKCILPLALARTASRRPVH